MFEGSLNVITGTVIMIVSMVGMGTLFMPSAVRNMDSTLLYVLFIGFSILSSVTLFILSHISNVYYKKAENNGRNFSYYDITSQYSELLAVFVDIALIIHGICVSIIYFKSITIFLIQVFNFEIDKVNFLFKIVMLLIVFILSFLFSTQKKQSLLVYGFYLSIFAIIYLIYMTIYYYKFLESYNQEIHDSNFEEIPKNNYKSISIFLFAINCHQNIVLVYSKLETKSMLNIMLIIIFTTLFSLSVYLIIGVFGYKLTGSTINNKDFISFMFEKGGNLFERISNQKYSFLWPRIATFGWVLVLFCSFSIQIHATRISLLNLFSLNSNSKHYIEKNINRSRIVITFLFLCIVTFLTMIFINNKNVIEQIIGFITATTGLVIMYFVPGIIFLCYNNNDGIFINCIIVVFLALILVLTEYLLSRCFDFSFNKIFKVSLPNKKTHKKAV